MAVTVKKANAKTKDGDPIELYVVSAEGLAIGRFETKASADKFAKHIKDAGGKADIPTIREALAAHGIKSKPPTTRRPG